jgi:hypothetical protein
MVCNINPKSFLKRLYSNVRSFVFLSYSEISTSRCFTLKQKIRHLTTLKGFLIKKGIHCGTHLKSRGTHFQNPNFMPIV